MRKSIILAGLLACAAAAGAEDYTFRDLGPGVPADINDEGQVVGVGLDGRPLRWSPEGEAVPLALPAEAEAAPRAIDSSGRVAGELRVPGGAARAALWSSAGALSTLALPAGPASAYGASDNGHVAGDMGDRAFVWAARTGARGLAGLDGGRCRARAVNNAGSVAGSATRSTVIGEVPQAVLWPAWEAVALDEEQPAGDAAAADEQADEVPSGVFRQSGPEPVVLAGLVEDQAAGSAALAINERGHLAGWAASGEDVAAGDVPRAVVWRGPGEVEALVPLRPGAETPSRAEALNNHDEVVGTAELEDGSHSPFLWTPTQGLRSLQSLAPRVEEYLDAVAINDRGQIVGTFLACSERHVFVLTPVAARAASPDGYAIERGIPLAGGLAELARADGAALEASASPLDAAVTVRLDAVAPAERPASLVFALMARAEGAAQQVVEFYDFARGAWVRVDLQAASPEGRAAVITPADASRFVEPPTRRVRARVQFAWAGLRAPGKVILPRAGIDRVEWSFGY